MKIIGEVAITKGGVCDSFFRHPVLQTGTPIGQANNLDTEYVTAMRVGLQELTMLVVDISSPHGT